MGRCCSHGAVSPCPTEATPPKRLDTSRRLQVNGVLDLRTFVVVFGMIRLGITGLTHATARGVVCPLATRYRGGVGRGLGVGTGLGLGVGLDTNSLLRIVPP
jgi:hypothetical protein